MLKRRKQSRNLWRSTSAIRRKRKLMNSKRKIFTRHRTFVQLSEYA